jgi:hypothetical protein
VDQSFPPEPRHNDARDSKQQAEDRDQGEEDHGRRGARPEDADLRLARTIEYGGLGALHELRRQIAAGGGAEKDSERGLGPLVRKAVDVVAITDPEVR